MDLVSKNICVINQYLGSNGCMDSFFLFSIICRPWMSLLGVDSGGSVKLLPIYLVKDDFIFQRVKPIEISSVSQYN